VRNAGRPRREVPSARRNENAKISSPSMSGRETAARLNLDSGAQPH